MSRKKTKEEIEYHLLLENTRELAKSRSGREFIWHILTLCDIYGESFTGNSMTYFNEGKRSIGLRLLSLLHEADPTIYPRLQLEKINLEVNDGSYDSSADTDSDYGD